METQKPIFQITQDKEIEPQFAEIADKLLNHWVLRISNERYRFAEIEFYYFNKIAHQDIFTHRSSEQEKNGNWYLHRKGESLKDGRRRGIDFTIGNEKEKSLGGILIRAIQNINDNKDYIYGPSNVVARIMKDLGKNKVLEIIDILKLPALDKENEIHIEPFELKEEQNYSCYRKGLEINKNESPENIELQKKFINKDYRIFILPLKKHNDKERIMNEWSLKNKYSDEKILSIFGRKNFTKKTKDIDSPKNENLKEFDYLF